MKKLGVPCVPGSEGGGSPPLGHRPIAVAREGGLTR